MKDVSACGTESPTTVEFSNTLQGTPVESHDDGSHHKLDQRRHQQHHVHSSSSNTNRTLPATSAMSNIQDQTSMQTNSEIVPSTLCNQQNPHPVNEVMGGRKFEEETVNSGCKQHHTHDHPSASAQMSSGHRLTEPHPHNFQTSDKSQNYNVANVHHKSSKHSLSFEDGSVMSRIVSVTNVSSSDVITATLTAVCTMLAC